jgi:hypothetical protein
MSKIKERGDQVNANRLPFSAIPAKLVFVGF